MARTDGWRNDLEAWIADEIESSCDAFAAHGDRRREWTIRLSSARAAALITCTPRARSWSASEYLDAGAGGSWAAPTSESSGESQPGGIQRVIAGVVLLTTGPGHGYRAVLVPDALDEIDRQLGPGVATPNHVLTVAGEAGSCPATEPEQVYYEHRAVPVGLPRRRRRTAC